jgi:hypothetical protein
LKEFYTVTWSLNGYPNITGTFIDFSKQTARNVSAQRFLKALFHNPNSLLGAEKKFSWMQMTEFIQSKKKPLVEILDLNE